MPNVYPLCEKCGKSGCQPPNTRCSACRRQRASRAGGNLKHARPEDARWAPRPWTWVAEQLELYTIEWQAARIWGTHQMGAIEDDSGPGGFLSRCSACLGFLVGDPEEADEKGRPTPFYGRAYHTQCTGTPPPAPANRRDEMDLDAAWTSLGYEAADRNPPNIDINNWLDDEHGPGWNKTMKQRKR